MSNEEVCEKREILRDLYGGTMSLRDLMRELGASPAVARAFGRRYRLGFRIGARIRYDTDAFAELIVSLRTPPA